MTRRSRLPPVQDRFQTEARLVTGLHRAGELHRRADCIDAEIASQTKQMQSTQNQANELATVAKDNAVHGNGRKKENG